MGMLAGNIKELTDAENCQSEHCEQSVVSHVLGG